jgi:hypothetical protein
MQALPPPGSRVAFYSRYSTALQSYSSIEGQERGNAAYAEKLEWIETGRYSDAERSGTTTMGRQGLFQMLAAAERGEFDVLLMEDIDRASRDAADMHRIAKDLDELDIVLCTVAGGVVTDRLGPALDTDTIVARIGATLDNLQQALGRDDREASRAHELVRGLVDKLALTPTPGSKADGRGAGDMTVTVEGPLAALIDLADLSIDRVAKHGHRPSWKDAWGPLHRHRGLGLLVGWIGRDRPLGSADKQGHLRRDYDPGVGSSQCQREISLRRRRLQRLDLGSQHPERRLDPQYGGGDRPLPELCRRRSTRAGDLRCNSQRGVLDVEPHQIVLILGETADGASRILSRHGADAGCSDGARRPVRRRVGLSCHMAGRKPICARRRG